MAPTLDQIEAFACGQFKAVLAHEPAIGLPIRTEWRESPDLVCTWPEKTVGVELTISNHWTEMRAHEMAVEDPRLMGRCTMWAGFRDGPIRQTKDEIREEVVHRLLGSGPWDNSDDLASATVDKMVKAIVRKTKNLNRPHYHCFQENWLAVSEYSGGAFCELTAHSIWQNLLDRLPRPGAEKNFDKIYLINGCFAAVIERNFTQMKEVVTPIWSPKLESPVWEFRAP